MKVLKNFKDLRKLGLQDIAHYSAAQKTCRFLRFSTGIHFSHAIRHVYRNVWPTGEDRPRFGAARVRSAHACETRLLISCYTELSRCSFARN